MQNYTPEPFPYPAEGRSDIAIDLDDEQSHAYSLHPVGQASPGKKAIRKPQPFQDKLQMAEPCHPAEGRPDVAIDLEEEQHDAYCSQHNCTSH